MNKDKLNILLEWKTELESQKKEIDSKLTHLAALVGENNTSSIVQTQKINEEEEINQSAEIMKATKKTTKDYTVRDIECILQQSDKTKGISIKYINSKLLKFAKNDKIKIKQKGIKGRHGKVTIYLHKTN